MDDHPRQLPPLRAGSELDLVLFDPPSTRPRHVFRATWPNMLAYASRMLPEVTPALRKHARSMQRTAVLQHEAAFAHRHRLAIAGLPTLLPMADALVRVHEAATGRSTAVEGRGSGRGGARASGARLQPLVDAPFPGAFFRLVASTAQLSSSPGAFARLVLATSGDDDLAK